MMSRRWCGPCRCWLTWLETDGGGRPRWQGRTDGAVGGPAEVAEAAAAVEESETVEMGGDGKAWRYLA